MSERVWRHETNPVWVCFYPEVEGVRPGHYIPYRACGPVQAGRDPWTLDNRRIGSDRGFPTLDVAISAANAASNTAK